MDSKYNVYINHNNSKSLDDVIADIQISMGIHTWQYGAPDDT